MTNSAFQPSTVLVRLPLTVAEVDPIRRQTRPIAEHSDLYNIVLTY